MDAVATAPKPEGVSSETPWRARSARRRHGTDSRRSAGPPVRETFHANGRGDRGTSMARPIRVGEPPGGRGRRSYAWIGPFPVKRSNLMLAAPPWSAAAQRLAMDPSGGGPFTRNCPTPARAGASLALDGPFLVQR